MNNVKIVSQEVVLESRSSFTIKRTKFALSSGKIYENLDAYRVPTVSIFPITPTYEIYLVSQYRYLLNEVTLEAPAGRIEESEDPLIAAKRELQEETGIIAKEVKELTTMDVAGSFIKAISYLYVAKDLTFGEKMLEEEESEAGLQVVKLSLDEALVKVLNKEIKTAATICGILILDKLRKERKI